MSTINQAVIVSAVRTPVGKLLGALKGFKATDLGAIVVREAVKRAGVKPEEVDEVIMGCVLRPDSDKIRRARRRYVAACPTRSLPSPSTKCAALV